MDKILITGGSGFLGHYLVEEFIKDHDVICLLRPDSKNLIRLSPYMDRIKVIYHDITQPASHLIKHLKDVSLVLHAAGNPSSEESTKNPSAAIRENILGTTYILDLCKEMNLERFFFYSAGEVYGPVQNNYDSTESDKHNILTMYAGTKSAADSLCLAYHHTFGIPISIMHVSNTFGERCQSNRFPVIAIRKLLNGDAVQIHKDAAGSIGGRRWIHAQDVALQTRFILNVQKTKCENWNSAGLEYYSNVEFSEMIANAMNVDFKYEFIQNDRIGHAPRFSCSPSKLIRHGWEEPINIQQRIQTTVDWYLKNKNWLKF